MNPGAILLCTFFIVSPFTQQCGFPVLKGPYLGQKPPGRTPELFAPGIVSTKADEYALEVSPSGMEILFSRSGSLMLATRNNDGTWNKPSVAPFSGKYIDGESCFSPDGKRIYFCSRRPAPERALSRSVWISEKSNGMWGEAYCLDGLVHSRNIHAPTVAASGNIYDDGIVRFKYVNGEYLPADKIPSLEGAFPFVAPDESYIIVARRDPGRRDSDLFVSFRDSSGAWTRGISLGNEINSSSHEGNSFVTADGKFLFFSRKLDVYWVDAKIIDDLRPKE